MPRFKQYNYKQTTMVPVCLEDQIAEGTIEFAIHYLLEHEIDLTIFDQKFNNDDTGCPAYDPKILLKIILFGYSRGIIHSRALERACRENIIFIALACGQAPDHTTIARFVSSMHDYILPLFQDVLMVCEKENLLGDTNYHSDANLQFAKRQKLDAYIPDPHFRQRDPRFADQGKYKPPKPRKKFTIDDFQYNEKKDLFTCPNGKQLKLIEKIDSTQGRNMYQQRIAIVEPVFGNIRSLKRMDRFTMRGKNKYYKYI